MNILITGSSQGIGSDLAKYFAKKKHNICVTYKNSHEEGVKTFSAVKTLYPDGKHYLSQLDVLDTESLEALRTVLEGEFGHLDLLICNAGIDFNAPIEKISYENWKKISHTKIDGSFNSTQSLLPLLKKSQNPNVIYISASVGVKPDWNDPAYSSASAAVINFGQSMAIALSEYSIRSNIVCPGPVKTNLQYWREVESKNPDVWENIASSNPLKRLCASDDIANLIEYIALNGTYMNGNTIYLNGGAHLK